MEEARLSHVNVIEAPRGSQYVDDAARIWAAATAARDGDDEVAGIELSRPVIQGVLDRSARALLLIALGEDAVAAGFAAIEPLGGASELTAEVRYLGVHPRNWSQGVGELLLRELPGRLRSAGFSRVILFVYTDNGRATALYERLGWQPSGTPAAHQKSGRLEQRYELPL